MTGHGKAFMNDHPLRGAVESFIAEKDADLWLFSGPIMEQAYRELVKTFAERPHDRERRETLYLYITTYGGSAEAAFKMSRLFQNFYKRTVMLIFGPCKSAGTLIAIAADELAFGPFGEIGPLDIQIIKPEELVWISGLDATEGLKVAGERLFGLYDGYVQKILSRSGPSLSFRTVNMIAKDLASEFIRPIAAQIDPNRLGEVERLIRIARSYAERLNRGNISSENIQKLVTGYPSHEFIIDVKEAGQLFENCRSLDDLEVRVANEVATLLLTPLQESKILDLGTLLEAQKEGDGDASDGAGKTKKPTRRGRKKTGQPEQPASGDTGADQAGHEAEDDRLN